jgi:hypothetical protein
LRFGERPDALDGGGKRLSIHQLEDCPAHLRVRRRFVENHLSHGAKTQSGGVEIAKRPHAGLLRRRLGMGEH